MRNADARHTLGVRRHFIGDREEAGVAGHQSRDPTQTRHLRLQGRDQQILRSRRVKSARVGVPMPEAFANPVR